MNCTIVLTISLLVLIASKAIFSAHESLNGQIHQDSASQRQNPVLEGSKVGSNYNNAVIFTSAEAEFEWNKFQVPGYDAGNADSDRLIEKARDTGRRLLEEGSIKHGALRGH